jgi:hypothetical protein
VKVQEVLTNGASHLPPGEITDMTVEAEAECDRLLARIAERTGHNQERPTTSERILPPSMAAW